MSTSVRAGISIGRKELALAVLKRTGQSSVLVFQHRVLRKDKRCIGELADLLKAIPSDMAVSELAVALSPAELACADCFGVSYRTEGQLDAVKASLAESRSCGETAEELCADLFQISASKTESIVELAAIQRGVLQAIRAALKEAASIPLVLVTTLPSALAHGLKLPDGEHTLAFLGETAVLHIRGGLPCGWQVFPAKTSGSDSGSAQNSGNAVELKGGLRVVLSLASAAAAASVDPGQMVNLLRDVEDAPKSLSAKLRRPLLQALGAAALLCFAAGLYFNKRAAICADGLERCAELERKLAESYLPGRNSGNASIKERVTQTRASYTRNRELNRAPSALSFWSEIGARIPSADKIGLSLESLQLSSDTGRLVARVDTTPADPLANASLLERALNSSEELAARGEFESKNNEVIVRLRLDYQPLGATANKERLAP